MQAAENRSLSGLLELGSQTHHESFESSNLDYSFYKKQFRFNDQLTPEISWKLAYQDGHKNYDRLHSLDNNCQRYQAGWDFLKKIKGGYFKIDCDAEYRVQTFDTGTQDNQRTKIGVGFAYNRTEDFFITWALGLTNNHHTKNSDHSESGIRNQIELGSYFFDNALRLEASHQNEDFDRIVGSDRTQSEKRLGLVYRVKTELLDTLRLSHAHGVRNTRDDDDDDFIMDYNFNRWRVSTSHKLWPKTSMDLNYENEIRDYDSEQRYSSFGDGMAVKIKYEPEYHKIYYVVGLGYRDRVYPMASAETHTKRYVTVKAVWGPPHDWRVILAGGVDWYRYRENSHDDRDVWGITPSLEKELFDGITMIWDYQCRLKSYLIRNQVQQNMLRVQFEYKFN